MRKIYQRHHKSVELKRLVGKLDQLSVNGRFAQLPQRQQQHLLKRFRKLSRQLRPDWNRIPLRPALFTLLTSAGLLGTVQTAQAQVPAFGPQQANPFGLTSVGYECKPSIVDIDNDGDLDVFAGDNGGNIDFFLNTGTATAPAFGALQTNPFGLAPPNTSFVSVHLQDMDNDGDFDLWYGDSGFDIIYFQNTGTNAAPAFAAPLTNPFGIVAPAGYAYEAKITSGDLDNDGDFDLLVGDNYTNFQYYQNTGTNAAPAFAAPMMNPFGLNAIGSGDYMAPTLVDIDGDGDLDIFANTNYGTTSYFENTGTVTAPAFGTPVGNPFSIATVNGYSVCIFADLDGDADLDLVQGDGYGNFQYQEDTSGVGTPNSAPVIMALANNDTVCSVDTLDFSFTAMDADGDSLTLTATSTNQAVISDANITLVGTNPNYDLTAIPTMPGTTDIIISVSDSQATTVDTISILVESCVVNVAPVLSLPANDTVCLGDTLMLPFTATDVNMDSLAFTATSSNQTVISNLGLLITGAPPNLTINILPAGLGDATIFIGADDGEFTVTDSFMVNVESCVVNSAPIVTAPANDTVCETDTLTLSFTASDANSDPLIFDAFSSDQAVVVNGDITITGTPPNLTITLLPSGLGDATITIEADDGTDVTLDSFMVNVEDCSVGLTEDFLARRFDVYPNPAQDRLHYELELFVPVESIDLELVDLTGRQVKVETFDQPGVDLNGILDVSGMARGVYFLRLSSELYTLHKKITIE